MWAIEIPGGLTIPVRRGTPAQEGNDYQEKVRRELFFDPAPGDYKPGGLMPDGLIINQKDNSRIALEVKYLSATERALRDPERSVRFIFKLDVEQARKYVDEYKGGYG